jgi:hypothetical protein
MNAGQVAASGQLPGDHPQPGSGMRSAGGGRRILEVRSIIFCHRGILQLADLILDISFKLFERFDINQTQMPPSKHLSFHPSLP